MTNAFDIFGMSFEGRIGLKGKPSRHFAFCEIGPVSPLPQPSEHLSLGLKGIRERRKTTNANRGLKHILSHVREKYFRRSGWRICITPVFGNGSEDIVPDYENVFSLFYDFVDMYCIDTTLADADGKRPLETPETFGRVLDALLNLRRCYDEYKPLLVRVSPGMDRQLLDSILGQCRLGGVEAMMVAEGDGTADTVRYLHDTVRGRYPIIACIHDLRPESIAEMLQAGAAMVQGTKRHGRSAARLEKLVWKILS